MSDAACYSATGMAGAIPGAKSLAASLLTLAGLGRRIAGAGVDDILERAAAPLYICHTPDGLGFAVSRFPRR
jgi:hypothetical protein